MVKILVLIFFSVSVQSMCVRWIKGMTSSQPDIDEWRGHEASYYEDLLMREEIYVARRSFVRLGESDYIDVILESGHRGIFKSDRNELDHFGSEIAAYRLARLIGFNEVPPTVHRVVNGRSGSLQLLIPGVETLNRIMGISNNIKMYNHLGFSYPENDIYRMNIFDLIIHNVDRKGFHNIVIDQQGRAIPIDHSRSFYVPDNNSRIYEDVFSIQEINRSRINDIRNRDIIEGALSLTSEDLDYIFEFLIDRPIYREALESRLESLRNMYDGT